jgi:threonine aldolase
MNTSKTPKNDIKQLWGHLRQSPKDFFSSMQEEVPYQEDFDFYGKGIGIEKFEKKMAQVLGKEDAVFMPSGTMAQQIALRVWSDLNQSNKVAYHPLSHLEIHEHQALHKLHPQLSISLLANEDRMITLKDIKDAKLNHSTLLLEVPQRELGGLLPSWDELKEISTWCRSNQITLHLDGARLWECMPYYQKSAASIASLFDSVYVSFYKGLGGLAGAILAADKQLINESRKWLRRYGGNLISLYPYYLSANKAYDERILKMPVYHKKAVEVAKIFNSIAGVTTIPKVVQTNMFHVRIKREKDGIISLEQKSAQVMAQHKLKVIPSLRKIAPSEFSFEFVVGDQTLMYDNESIENFIKKIFE